MRAWTGSAIGGIPPFRHDRALRTLLERNFLAFETVRAAEMPNAVFATDPRALAAATDAGTIGIAGA